MQKEVNEGKIIARKVLGAENPADLMTKILSKGEMIRRLRDMGMTFIE